MPRSLRRPDAGGNFLHKEKNREVSELCKLRDFSAFGLLLYKDFVPHYENTSFITWHSK